MGRAKAISERAAALLLALALLAAPVRADGGENASHILTYTPGSLVWDRATGIDENGAAVLSLFADAYQNVLSENGERVVAPGTDGHCTVRLVNEARYGIRYVAVAYRIKAAETLPVEPGFTCEGSEGTENYPLPEGVEESQVIRAVTGTLGGGETQDFRLDWLWEYYESDARDELDTALGDKAAFDTPDDVTAGIYIVVEDTYEPPLPPAPGGSGKPEATDTPETTDTPVETDAPGGGDGGWISPEVPKTGDDSRPWLYLALIILGGGGLALLLFGRRREGNSK